MSKARLISWFFQCLAAAILLPAAWAKLVSNPDSMMTFTQLGMEPFGRYLIGILEFIAVGQLLTRAFAAHGALLSVGIMLGAIIAHASVLGMGIGDDGGIHTILLVVVMVSSLIVMALNKKQIPFFGNVFED